MNDDTAKIFVAQSGLLSATAAPDHHAQYQAAQKEYKLAAGADEVKVPLTWTNGKGITVTKTYTFHRGSYAIDVDFEVTKVGEGAGFMGHVAILDLTLDPPAPAPVSLVLKIPTETDNRHLGQAVGVYEREIRFYQELAPGLQIRSPRHIYSAMDNESDPAKTVRALEILDRLPLWLIRRVFPILNWLGGPIELAIRWGGALWQKPGVHWTPWRACMRSTGTAKVLKHSPGFCRYPSHSSLSI